MNEMGRKLPKCALCGESLAYRYGMRILLQYTDLPGSPTVGWHAGTKESPGCTDTDAAAEALFKHLEQKQPDGGNPVPLLEGIERRGEGRLVAGKKWQARLA